MDFKEKEAKKNIVFFLAKWGRGKRFCPSNPKPVPPKAVKPVRVKAMKIPKLGKAVKMIGLAEMELHRYGIVKTDPTKPLSSGYNFGAWLVKRGFKKLGSGAYSTIYGKDGQDRVIKVTAGSQDNWIDYIQWAAQKGYCGSLAPRVYSWKKFKIEGGEFSVSVVERMEKCISNAEDSDPYILQHLMRPAIQGHTLAQCYMEDIVPGSVKFFEGLKERFPGGHDLYGKNMMLRTNGTFCVTDPVCGKSEVKINRLRSTDFTSVAPAIRYIYNL